MQSDSFDLRLLIENAFIFIEQLQLHGLIKQLNACWCIRSWKMHSVQFEFQRFSLAFVELWHSPLYNSAVYASVLWNVYNNVRLSFDRLWLCSGVYAFMREQNGETKRANKRRLVFLGFAAFVLASRQTNSRQCVSRSMLHRLKLGLPCLCCQCFYHHSPTTWTTKHSCSLWMRSSALSPQTPLV